MIQTLSDQAVATRRARVPLADLAQFFDGTYRDVLQAIQAQGLRPAGPPFARYWGPVTDSADVEAGFPVTGFATHGDIQAASLPGGDAVVGTHVGPYESLGQTWQSLEQWAQAQGRARRGDQCWEIYLTDPSAEPDPDRWRTQVVLPLA